VINIWHKLKGKGLFLFKTDFNITKNFKKLQAFGVFFPGSEEVGYLEIEILGYWDIGILRN